MVVGDSELAKVRGIQRLCIRAIFRGSNVLALQRRRPSSLCGLATFCKKNNDGLNLKIRLLIFAAVFM